MQSSLTIKSNPACLTLNQYCEETVITSTSTSTSSSSSSSSSSSFSCKGNNYTREKYDWIIRGATLIDGTGKAGYQSDVGVIDEKIVTIGDLAAADAHRVVEAEGLCLAPGFIDVHTHDDIQLIKSPDMLCKISQGVATVIVGNCGISASPVVLQNAPPDPMNLLGEQEDFVFDRVETYARAIGEVKPAVNVAVLVGHTSLRNNVMDCLNRAATGSEIQAMRVQLRQALADGAIGLSSGLAYASAVQAPAAEVMALAEVLAEYNGVYTTHLRDEFDGIVKAMEEAFQVGGHARVPVVISHFKCAGAANWGRTRETIPLLSRAAEKQEVSCDCYPYSASSSTLDLNQVTDEFDIFITWSESHPEEAGQRLTDIADKWRLPLQETAAKLLPAGAVYHNMDEADVQRVLQYAGSMIGSDGLPNDPLPHPRLWGAFPRVIGHYCRNLGLFELPEAIRKMTGLPAQKFNLAGRGRLREGFYADLVLFDPETIIDTASFENPRQVARGIHAVWVNGGLGYQHDKSISKRWGRFLSRADSLQTGRGGS